MSECWCATSKSTGPRRRRKWARISRNPSLPLIDSEPIYGLSPYTAADTGHRTRRLDYLYINLLVFGVVWNPIFNTPQGTLNSPYLNRCVVRGKSQKLTQRNMLQAICHISKNKQAIGFTCEGLVLRNSSIQWLCVWHCDLCLFQKTEHIPEPLCLCRNSIKSISWNHLKQSSVCFNKAVPVNNIS